MDHRVIPDNNRHDRALNQEPAFEEPLLARERVEELRHWIADGGPHRADVVDTVARRMLARGDIF